MKKIKYKISPDMQDTPYIEMTPKQFEVYMRRLERGGREPIITIEETIE